ncbi:MAG TPA: hypothetical protein VF615_20315 [Longimicrobiaceae bacterium]|jgi:hypothetical protein
MNLHRTFGLCALLLALAPAAAHACSLSGLATTQWPGTAHLVATARADTVAAGPGSVRDEVGSGRTGPARGRAVYGQVVEVERVGGMTASEVGRSAKRAVLVPWGYGDDCRPAPWPESARWVEPGERGLFIAMLRDRAHWAGGLPTFDVYLPDANPFPQRPGREGSGVPADSLMSADDYFALMEILPTPERVKASAADAFRPLERWAERHPAPARRFPARDLLAHARHEVEHQRLRSISPPLAGTYRFEARLADGAPRVFYARTRTRPTTWWRPALAGGRTAEGYTLLLSGAASPDSLPADAPWNRRMDREGYASVLVEPEPGAGARTWRGRIETSLVARQFPADSALRDFARAEFARFFDRHRRGEPEETPARFVEAPDGTVRVTQMIRLDDGRTLHVSGTRVSRSTVAEP